MCFHIYDEELYETRSGATVWVAVNRGRVTFEVVDSPHACEIGMTGIYSGMGHVLCSKNNGHCELHPFDAVRHIYKYSRWFGRSSNFEAIRLQELEYNGLSLTVTISQVERYEAATAFHASIWKSMIEREHRIMEMIHAAARDPIIDAGWPPKVAMQHDERARTAVPV